MGSGPAGEVTYADIRERLAKVVGHYTDAALLARQASQQVAANRDNAESTDDRSE